jgi:hypothetical protein
LWHKFGTPTNRAESGTLEEFQRAKARFDKDRSSVALMIYFKDAPVQPSQINVQQLASVQAFRDSLGNEGGLYWKFQATDDFVNLVRIHLTRVAQEWHGKLSPPGNGPSPPSSPPGPSNSAGAGAIDTEDMGILEISEGLEDSFNEATEILNRILKSIESIGKKIREHTKRIDLANSTGQMTRPKAKRMFAKAASDMEEFAAQLNKEVPQLRTAMTAGADALSNAISLWPDFINDQFGWDHVSGWLSLIQKLIAVLSESEAQTREYLGSVVGLPRVSSDLNRAKRTVATAVQSFIDLLSNQQSLLEKAEKSAQLLYNARPAFGT